MIRMSYMDIIYIIYNTHKENLCVFFSSLYIIIIMIIILEIFYDIFYNTQLYSFTYNFILISLCRPAREIKMTTELIDMQQKVL